MVAIACAETRILPVWPGSSVPVFLAEPGVREVATPDTPERGVVLRSARVRCGLAALARCASLSDVVIVPPCRKRRQQVGRQMYSEDFPQRKKSWRTARDIVAYCSTCSTCSTKRLRHHDDRGS